MLRREFLQAGFCSMAMAALKLRTFDAAAGPAVPKPPSSSTDFTISSASELIRTRKASPVELTQACLAAIEKLNPALNAFITVISENAIAQARKVEGEVRRGNWRGPLHGIPIAIKDNIDTAGVKTTAASELFKDRVPREDAEVVRRLKDAGAIVIGKTNLHEFAFGGTSAVSYFGAVHNPWAPNRVPGGSSGGSAAAVAARLCPAALGTDTAGSVRIPASYCGVVGFKPTYGLVSTRGVIPAAWTFDHVGTLCRTVSDAAILTAILAGYDEFDSASVRATAGNLVPTDKPNAKLRIGVVRTPFFAGVDADVAAAVETAIGVVKANGSSIHDVELTPPAGHLLDLWAKVRTVEAYAYHERWITTSPNLYQPATRERLQAPTISASEYAQLRREVEDLRRRIRLAFASVDVLVTPTMPTSPITIVEGANPMAVSIRNTAPFNVLGIPTISIPCGFTQSGLPIGLQMSAAPFADATVLQVAHQYEQATHWHTTAPRI